MVGKTPALGDHCKDLEEIFAQIKKRNMRLNHEKCAFGVKAGIFLSFMITTRGIEANMDKCLAIIEIEKPFQGEGSSKLSRESHSSIMLYVKSDR